MDRASLSMYERVYRLFHSAVPMTFDWNVLSENADSITIKEHVPNIHDYYALWYETNSIEVEWRSGYNNAWDKATPIAFTNINTIQLTHEHQYELAALRNCKIFENPKEYAILTAALPDNGKKLVIEGNKRMYLYFEQQCNFTIREYHISKYIPCISPDLRHYPWKLF